MFSIMFMSHDYYSKQHNSYNCNLRGCVFIMYVIDDESNSVYVNLIGVSFMFSQQSLKLKTNKNQKLQRKNSCEMTHLASVHYYRQV